MFESLNMVTNVGIHDENWNVVILYGTMNNYAFIRDVNMKLGWPTTIFLFNFQINILVNNALIIT